jgi:hypothetical protein
MTDQEKIKWLTDYYNKKNYPIDDINIIGIRDEKDMDKDKINDFLGYWTRDEIFLCPGTTDPGVYWTKDPARNSEGTFHLLDGFHKAIWCVGTHRGYEALANDWRYCKPTSGWRDLDYDFVRDPTDVVTCDYYGINFHHMSANTVVDKVGMWSAGCQVVQKIDDFNKIMKAVKNSGMYKHNPGKTVFNYMMFKIEDVRGILV